jgi:hypothetical protein
MMHPYKIVTTNVKILSPQTSLSKGLLQAQWKMQLHIPEAQYEISGPEQKK